jgi:hypothetical protein
VNLDDLLTDLNTGSDTIQCVKRWGLVALWALALVLTTTLTWRIVSAAGQQVNATSGAPLEVGPPAAGPTTTTTIGPPTTTTPTSTPPPSNPGSSPTTDATSAESETVVIPTDGGTVTVNVGSNGVTYLSAVPRPGFAVEIDDPGPPRVRVEFESDEARVEVRAEVRDGELEIEIDSDD